LGSWIADVASTAVKFNLKGVVEDKDRHGNIRLYFRAPGRKKVRLREVPGSAEFHEEVRCARDGVPYARIRSASKPVTRTTASRGSLLWLCQEYFRRGGAEVSEATMLRRRSILEGICKLPHPLSGPVDRDFPTKGSLPFAAMKRAHVKELRDTRADAPGAANNIAKAISAMFAWAKDAEIVDVNPANGIKRLTTGDGEGFHTWEVSEIVQFENRHPRGTTARMALAIFMFTGLRLSDAAIFGRQHISQIRNRETGAWEKWIKIKPGKTDKSKVRREPVVVEIPLLPELEDELSFAPTGNLTFLVTEYGQPFSENGLGNKMRQWCDEAGLPNCSAHGVRKAGATVAAENGATHEQLKAIYGWTTYQQPDHYIRKARRRKVAQSARTLLVFDRNENEIVPLSEGVEKSGTKKIK
jgi:integrase